MICYLSQYSPFHFVDNESLVNISSGLSSSTGDGVNSDEAENVGLHVLEQWDDQPYCAVSVQSGQSKIPLCSVT